MNPTQKYSHCSNFVLTRKKEKNLMKRSALHWTMSAEKNMKGTRKKRKRGSDRKSLAQSFRSFHQYRCNNFSFYSVGTIYEGLVV